MLFSFSPPTPIHSLLYNQNKILIHYSSASHVSIFLGLKHRLCNMVSKTLCDLSSACSPASDLSSLSFQSQEITFSSSRVHVLSVFHAFAGAATIASSLFFFWPHYFLLNLVRSNSSFRSQLWSLFYGSLSGPSPPIYPFHTMMLHCNYLFISFNAGRVHLTSSTVPGT